MDSTIFTESVLPNTDYSSGIVGLPTEQIEQGNRWVFIDSRVDNLQQLMAGIENAQFLLLDPEKDGIKEITQTLAKHQGVSSVHIVSHGEAGSVLLGQAQLNAATLLNYAPDLQKWANSLTSSADILFYGCHVGAGQEGVAFVETISQLSGADIGASEDVTGNADLGGDWDLEVSTGSIEAPLPFRSDVLEQYQSILPFYNGREYILTNGAKNWENAQIEALSQGGNLVTINDAAEEDWLKRTFSSTEAFWIGLTDRRVEGQFEWINGELSEYRNWAPTEPNNKGGNQDYVNMNFLSTRQWDDKPINFQFRGIIEINPIVARVNFQPATSLIPNGYIADTGRAYSATRGYGWITESSVGSGTSTPVNISKQTRDRKIVNVDPRLNTFLQMNAPTAGTPRVAWEYALPNGQYSVTVSVGDPSFKNSQHRINVEGVEAISTFIPNSMDEFELATATVNVSDGKLTIDSIGGTNTKINFVDIYRVTAAPHPSILNGLPRNRQFNIDPNAAITLDLNLISVNNGVQASTLTAQNVQLYRTRDNALVPSNINTSGGADSIVLQPTVPLDPLTDYTFRLSNEVLDELHNSFVPFSTTFTTGPKQIDDNEGINFNKSTVFTGAAITSLEVSPDATQLYGVDFNGLIHRWTIGASAELTNHQIFTGLIGRVPIGIVFDPNNSNVLWISHNDPLGSNQNPAEDFTGKISKLTLQSGSDFNAVVEDYVVGLPRSIKDHLSNSLEFGPDGFLYMTQGSNSAMGAPDDTWGNRQERLLSAAVLRIDTKRTAPIGGFNVQTEDYNTPGNYNPYATNAPVKIFATGVRNAYDLVWHSDGFLFVPTNGSAAGGNTPDDPSTLADESLVGVATQNDYLFRVQQGGYYGHPNPTRNEYILNGGNPTALTDLAEVRQYPVGTAPDPDYGGFVYDFGRNRSPNGAIEYTSNAFGGILQNNLMVVEYSGGDDILSFALDESGNIVEVRRIADGFNNPLDLVEHPSTGNIYVSELGSAQITLLQVSPS